MHYREKKRNRKVSGTVLDGRSRRRLHPLISLAGAAGELGLSTAHLHYVVRGVRNHPATLARYKALLARLEAAAAQTISQPQKKSSTSKITQ